MFNILRLAWSSQLLNSSCRQSLGQVTWMYFLFKKVLTYGAALRSPAYLWVMLSFTIFLFPSPSQAVARESGCRGRGGGTRSPRRGPAPAEAQTAASSASAAAGCSGRSRKPSQMRFFQRLKRCFVLLPSLHAPTEWSKADGRTHSSARRQWACFLPALLCCLWDWKQSLEVW